MKVINGQTVKNELKVMILKTRELML